MDVRPALVKTLALAACLGLLAAVAPAGESAPEAAVARPHMMYFYNPSCRLCTTTNEVVAKAEEQYGSAMSHQRLNIADPDSGTDNVMYMFELMDEMKVPESTTVTLVVFLGLLDEEDGETYFTPKRVLVEGEEIIEKLDKEIADFLSETKGGEKLSLVRPAPFFFHECLRVAGAS